MAQGGWVRLSNAIRFTAKLASFRISPVLASISLWTTGIPKPPSITSKPQAYAAIDRATEHLTLSERRLSTFNLQKL
jgi:hypothetical protein